ncbi:LysR family transcriptional regulator [Pseudomonas sp. PD9R]|uniref:LysR family transcriptional regulator n=1 Tax=Pseudomonas sp. PD9R TaxID=2853534 RepID=UPI001C44B1A9|nr:LysR family transcriptional regulator [Pseudomonas sp. PD9R]MBV6823119.1 LysR family transcriptional regulator [Pseudomonas sp. PD9R]
MDRFSALEIFVRVVEIGSFSKTATELAISQSTVSKNITDLEKQLQAKLLSRTTRRLSLTEAGEGFYEQAKLILEQYSMALGDAVNVRQTPSGTLRMATPILLGRKQLTPLLPRFFERYPDIVVEHYLSDSETDLIRDGVDVSIRVGEMKDSSHQARKLGVLQPITVASPDFLQKYPAITHPRDLASVPCLIYLRHPAPFEWSFISATGEAVTVDVNGPYRVNVFEALCEAAIAGLGILQAPLSACGADLEAGRLVRLLPDYDAGFVPIYAVMPSSSWIPQKTRVMVDFLVEEFQRNPWLNGSDQDVGM